MLFSFCCGRLVKSRLKLQKLPGDVNYICIHILPRKIICLEHNRKRSQPNRWLLSRPVWSTMQLSGSFIRGERSRRSEVGGRRSEFRIRNSEFGIQESASFTLRTGSEQRFISAALNGQWSQKKGSKRSGRKRRDVCDIKIAKQKYEALRANALGSIHRTSGFTMFLWVIGVTHSSKLMSELWQWSLCSWTAPI